MSRKRFLRWRSAPARSATNSTQPRHARRLAGQQRSATCCPAAALGLGATVKTDRREIAAAAFFTGLYETALQDGEVITSVSFPIPQQAGWQKFKQPASRFSIVGVFVAKTVRGESRRHRRRALCVPRQGAGGQAEHELVGAGVRWREGRCRGLNTDLHGSAEYRAALIPVLAARTVGAS